MNGSRRGLRVDDAGHGKIVNWLYTVALIAVIVAAFLYMVYFRSELGGESYLKVPASAEFTITRKETISVSRTPIDYSFRIYYPPELPEESSANTGEIQHIEKVTTDPAPTKGGQKNSYMIWEKDDFTGTDSIVITYMVKSKTVKWEFEASKSGDVEDIKDETVRKWYLGDQWAEDKDGDGEPEDSNGDGKPDHYKIEPSNPVVSSQARQIVGNETNVYKMVYDIYRWMTHDGGFSYSLGREGTPAMAENTLKAKRGDCDDQSILFMSLLRSLGIPAWLEVGTLYDERGGTWFGHAWSNVYIPTSDGGFEVVAVDVVNEQFLFRTCNHMTDWTDDGVRGFSSGGKWVKSHLADYYFFFSYEYRSNKNPKVMHSEEFITVDYTPTGTVLYDTETGESRTVRELPHGGTHGTIIILLAVVGIGYARRKEN